MRRTFKTFKEYFEHYYYEQLVNLSKRYLNANRDKFHTNYIPNPNFIEFEEMNVMGIHFRETEKLNEFTFYLAVSICASIKGKTYRYKGGYYDDDSAEVWVGILCSATLDDGLKNVKFLNIDDYSKQKYIEEKTLSKYLVPYFSNDKMDQRAEQFLSRYYPEALKTPMPLPVEEITKRLGLNLYYAALPDSIFGRTYFAESIEKVYNENGFLVDSKVKKGSVLINRNFSFMESVGSENNTIIHECIHWAYHRKFFELQHLLNSENKNISCIAVDDYISKGNLTEEIEWMEWQANSLAPRILMPAKNTKAVFNATISKLKKENPSITNIDLYERALKETASFFNVTISAMKVRLMQLGFYVMVGINTFIDKENKGSYFFSNKLTKENQTYRLDFVDSLLVYLTKPTIKKLVDEKKIIYADGFYVLNQQGYVKYSEEGKLVLTDYAREHVDECCLLFNVDERFTSRYDKSFYSMCFLCRNASSNNNTSVGFDENEYQNQIIIDKTRDMTMIEDEIEEMLDIKKLIQSDDVDFNEAFRQIIKYYGYNNNSAIARWVGLSEGTIRGYIAGSTRPSNVEIVVAICGGLKLHPDISEILISKSGFSLGKRGKQDDFVYQHLIRSCYREGLVSWNKRLQVLDMAPLP